MTENKREEERRKSGKETCSLKGGNTVGEILLEARKKTGLSRSEISESTRVPEDALKFLETDNFDMIPARVYVRGFLKSYAGHLGLDVEYILSKYEVQTGQTHNSKGDYWEVEEDIDEEPAASSNLIKGLVAAAVLVIIIVIISLFANGDGDGPEISPPSAIPRAGEFARSPAGGETAEREGERSEQPEQAGRAREVEGESVSGSKGAAGKKPEQMELKLIANSSDSTWISLVAISSSDGGPDSSYFEFVLLPGSVRTFSATSGFWFRTIGNAGGFSMEFGGKSIPPLGRENEVLKDVYVGKDGVVTNED